MELKTFFFLSSFFNAITESMQKTSCFMHLVRLKTNTERTGCLQAACTWQLPGRDGDAGEMSWNDLSPHSIYRIYFTRLNPLSITLAVATQKETKKDVAILHKEQAANPHLLTKHRVHTQWVVLQQKASWGTNIVLKPLYFYSVAKAAAIKWSSQMKKKKYHNTLWIFYRNYDRDLQKKN